MRHFIKCVLVTAVILFGFHTASRFKASSPQQTNANVAESDAAALSSHPDAQPTGRDSAWQAPAAALNDTDQFELDPIEPDSLDTFERPTLQGQTAIEKPSRVEPFGLVEDPSNKKSPWWDEGPSQPESASTHKPNIPEKPNGRKKPSTAKNTRAGKKAHDSAKRQAGGKSDDDKQTKRPFESVRSDKETGWNDSSQPPNSAPATPEWPIGDRLASSTKTPSTQQLRKENQWPWEDESETASRSNSSFERGRAGKSENQPRSNDDKDRTALDKGKPRGSEKSKEPVKDDRNPRSAEELERHQIVDGDTLPKLAVAYLGDRERYMDIFRANRDVLSDPRLLPIGAEIAIPASRSHDSDRSTRPSADKNNQTASSADVDGEMVPIPTFALPPRISR